MFALLLLVLAVAAQSEASSCRAHAHNDYEHARPLLDALEHEFCSIEVDIHLEGGELLVAHSRLELDPERTIRNLYLDVLAERTRDLEARAARHGPLLLLVDIKSEGIATYRALDRVLADYRHLLTSFEGDNVSPGLVTVIVSGNRPRALMETQKTRLAAYDGRLADLEANPPPPVSFMPLVSSNWIGITTWRGPGRLPRAAKRRLREVVQKAHSQGRLLRFWATPERPDFWRLLLRHDVDLINTDELGALREFLDSTATGGGR